MLGFLSARRSAGQRQRDGDGGAFPFLAVQREVAAVHRDNLVGDRKPDARAAPGGVGLVKAGLDLGQVLLGDADAGVADLNDRVVFAVLHRDGDAVARVGIL